MIAGSRLLGFGSERTVQKAAAHFPLKVLPVNGLGHPAIAWRYECRYCALMLAALMIGHHFSTSAL